MFGGGHENKPSHSRHFIRETKSREHSITEQLVCLTALSVHRVEKHLARLNLTLTTWRALEIHLVLQEQFLSVWFNIVWSTEELTLWSFTDDEKEIQQRVSIVVSRHPTECVPLGNTLSIKSVTVDPKVVFRHK